MGLLDGRVLILTGGGHRIRRAMLWRMIRWAADEPGHSASRGQRELFDVALRGIAAALAARL